MVTATLAWLDLLRDCKHSGDEYPSRLELTKELRGQRAVVDMAYPLLMVPARRLGYHFQAAEAAWILSGDNRVTTIAPFSKTIKDYSDDGHFFFGAYGPRIVDQLSYIIRTLAQTPDSRQAVLTIWRPNPPPTRDVPCSISVQFLIRHAQLNLFYNMRSSDIWLGVPYDWFNFSMLAGYVLLLLDRAGLRGLRLGSLYYYAASAHLYQRDWARAWSILGNHDQPEAGPRFDPLAQFTHPQALVDYLWRVARQEVAEPNFLTTFLEKTHVKKT